MSVQQADPGMSATAPLTMSAETDLPSDTISVTETPPELAMQGYCAVTVLRDNVWVEGKREFGVVHLGKLYLFEDQEKLETFLADPIPFTPVLNEIDVVRFFEERVIVPGKREFGIKVYDRMWFFADEAARDHFELDYERYVQSALDVMEKAVRVSNPES